MEARTHLLHLAAEFEQNGNVFGRARCLEAALLTNPPPQLEGQIRLALGRLVVKAGGDTDMAVVQLTRAHLLLEKHNRSLALEALFLGATLTKAHGRVQEAKQQLRHGLTIAEKLPQSSWFVRFSIKLSEILHSLNHQREALGILSSALARVTDTGDICDSVALVQLNLQKAKILLHARSQKGCEIALNTASERLEAISESSNVERRTVCDLTVHLRVLQLLFCQQQGACALASQHLKKLQHAVKESTATQSQPGTSAHYFVSQGALFALVYLLSVSTYLQIGNIASARKYVEKGRTVCDRLLGSPELTGPFSPEELEGRAVAMHIKMGLVEQEGHILLIESNLAAVAQVCAQGTALLASAPRGTIHGSFHAALHHLLSNYYQRTAATDSALRHATALLTVISSDSVPSASASVAVAAAHSQMLLIARDSANSEQVNAIQSLLKNDLEAHLTSKAVQGAVHTMLGLSLMIEKKPMLAKESFRTALTLASDCGSEPLECVINGLLSDVFYSEQQTTQALSFAEAASSSALAMGYHQVMEMQSESLHALYTELGDGSKAMKAMAEHANHQRTSRALAPTDPNPSFEAAFNIPMSTY